MRVPLLNFEGGPEVPLLNFEEGPWAPLLNFEWDLRSWVAGLGVLVPLLQHANKKYLIISMRKLINLYLKFSYMTSFKHSL